MSKPRNRKPTHAQKIENDDGSFVRNQPIKPFIARTTRQKELWSLLEDKVQVFVFGPAGVGKTFVSLCYAAEMYLRGNIKKIVITRPVVGLGKTIGLLPGTKDEKMEQWMREAILILQERLGRGTFEIAMKHGDIEIAALEFIRGRSFEDTFIFMTESQNSTVAEMEALVTRIGEGSQIVIDGDITQTDLRECDGMVWALETVKNNDELYNMSGVVEFELSDIVRSGLCAAWVKSIWSKKYGKVR